MSFPRDRNRLFEVTCGSALYSDRWSAGYWIPLTYMPATLPAGTNMHASLNTYGTYFKQM